MSFFGGDPSVSHFTVDVRYLTPDERWDKETNKPVNEEAYKNKRQRRLDQRATLKGLGFKTPYFQYRNKDEAGKAQARAKAEAFHREWSEKVGFELEIAEGCFL